MTLRGKDYCNCEHAHMLRRAIEQALASELHRTNPGLYAILQSALDTDHAACLELWGDLKESE